MKTSKMFTAMFAVLAMASCSNDNEIVNQPNQPDTNVPEVYASFSISIPHATDPSKAFSRTADPGTDAENTVKSLHVFIYDAESPYTPSVAEFTVAKGTLKQASAGSSQWITTEPVSTRKADKYIFAGINLNTDIVNYITTNGLGSFSYKEFSQDVSKLADQSNGFVMFNDAYPAITPAADLYENKTDAETNHISISVNRVTAKATAYTAQNFIVNGGGAMTDIKFGWRNLNKKFYFIQDQREALIKDYNWDNYTVQDFARGTDAISVNAYNVAPTSFSYATENAFQYVSGTSNIDGATFISISGVFHPDNIIAVTTPSPASAADFEIQSNSAPAGSTFYVVRTADDIANYFIDGTVAQTYADLCIAGTPGMPAFHGHYTLADNTYTNGLCYFHIFVNGNAVSPQAPYNIYRNQYFKIKINSIQAPGNPSDNFDKGKPIQPNSWVGVDIEIDPWEVIEEDHDL